MQETIAKNPILSTVVKFLFPGIAERQKRAEALVSKAFSYKLVLTMDLLETVPYRDWEKLDSAIYRWGHLQDIYRRFVFSDPATRDMAGQPSYEGLMSLLEKYSAEVPYWDFVRNLQYLYPIAIEEFIPKALRNGEPDIYEIARLMGFSLPRGSLDGMSVGEVSSFSEALRFRGRFQAETAYRLKISDFEGHPGYGWLESNLRDADLDIKMKLDEHPFGKKVLALEKLSLPGWR